MPASNRDEELARELFSSVQVSPTHGPFQWLQIYHSEGQDEPDLSTPPPNPGHPSFFCRGTWSSSWRGCWPPWCQGSAWRRPPTCSTAAGRRGCCRPDLSHCEGTGERRRTLEVAAGSTASPGRPGRQAGNRGGSRSGLVQHLLAFWALAAPLPASVQAKEKPSSRCSCRTRRSPERSARPAKYRPQCNLLSPPVSQE